MPTDSVVTNPVRSRAVGRLEPCAGKLACTVLREEHAGNGVFFPDGKARTPYEFGVKVTIATTLKEGLVVGMRSMPGNPWDGHTLAETLEQVEILADTRPKIAIVDKGYQWVKATACASCARARSAGSNERCTQWSSGAARSNPPSAT